MPEDFIACKVYPVDTKDRLTFKLPRSRLQTQSVGGVWVPNPEPLVAETLIADKLKTMPQVVDRRLSSLILPSQIVLNRSAQQANDDGQSDSPTIAYCHIPMDYHKGYMGALSDRTYWKNQASNLLDSVRVQEETISTKREERDAGLAIMARTPRMPEHNQHQGDLTPRERELMTSFRRSSDTFVTEYRSIILEEPDPLKEQLIKKRKEYQDINLTHEEMISKLKAEIDNELNILRKDYEEKYEERDANLLVEIQAQREKNNDTTMDIQALNKEVKAQQERFDIGIQDLDDTLQELNNSVQTNTRTLQGLDSTLQGLDSTLQGLDSTLQGLDSTLQGLDSKLQGLDSKLQGLDSTLQGLDSTLQGLDSTLQTNTRTLEAQEVRIAMLDEGNEALDQELKAQAAELERQGSDIVALIADDRVAIRNIKLRNLLDNLQGILGRKFFPENGDQKYASKTFRDELGRNAPTVETRLPKLNALFRSHRPEVWSQSLLNHKDALKMLVDPNPSARALGNKAAHYVLPRPSYESAIAEVTNEKDKAVYETLLKILLPKV